MYLLRLPANAEAVAGKAAAGTEVLQFTQMANHAAVMTSTTQCMGERSTMGVFSGSGREHEQACCNCA